MATALATKQQPKPRTLGEFLAAANCPVPQKWMWKLGLAEEPFYHQVETLNHYGMHVRSGDFSEPGTGKTFPAQAYATWLIGYGNKVVVVMPPLLTPQFLASFRMMFPDIEQHITVERFAGKPTDRDALIQQWEAQGWPDVLVMSYRMFVGDKGISEPGFDAKTFTWRTLLARGYTCVIVDEATAVKTAGTQIHNAVKCFAGKYGEESNGVILMTGTPIENTLEDAYGLIAILNPLRYGSKKAFDRVHCIQADVGGFMKTVGYMNEDYLYQGLYSVGRRVLKKDVSDVPPRIISEVPIELSESHMRLYKKLVDERILEFEDGSVIDATSASACYQIMQQILMTPERYTDRPPAENHLLDTLDELVKSIGAHKILIYAWYRHSVEKLLDHFKRLNPAVLYGGVSGQERENEKQKFIKDPTCRLIVAQPRSGGVGVDGFQHVCSHVIYAEVCPIPGVFQQSIDRLHRTGQQAESVNIYILVALKTIAVKLRNDLTRRDSQANSVVRDKRTLLADLLGEEGLRGSLD
jgi:hypothetical protein